MSAAYLRIIPVTEGVAFIGSHRMCELPTYAPFQARLGSLGLSGYVTQLPSRVLHVRSGHIRPAGAKPAQRPDEVLLEGQALVVPRCSVVDQETAERVGAILREQPFAYYVDADRQPDALENYTTNPPQVVTI